MKLKPTMIVVAAGAAMALSIAAASAQPATERAAPATSAAAAAEPALQPTTVAVATQPATIPTTLAATTQPASGAVSPMPPNHAMPANFVLLTTRSIFLKGHGPLGGASPAATTRPAPRLEDSLIFNGVTRTDGAIVAFLEDISAARVTRVQVGDAVANGKVTGITLDTLEYESNGRITRVAIGQALSGAESMGATTLPSSSPDSGGGGDVLERMRRARLQGK